MAGSITAANAVFSLTVPGIFNAPIQIQGYANEKAWSSDAQKVTESRIGVDGVKASGWVPNMIRQTVALLPNSNSRSVFNSIARAMKANRDVIILQGTIVLPSTGEAFSLINGTLEEYKPLEDAGKVLQDIDYVIEWQDIQPTLT
jgi:hypothetical protein